MDVHLPPAWNSYVSVAVDGLNSQCGEELVGLLLLIQRLLQQDRVYRVSELFCPGPGAAVIRHLVMLHALGTGQESNIEDAGIGILFHEVGSFLDDPLNASTQFALWTLSQLLEDLV